MRGRVVLEVSGYDDPMTPGRTLLIASSLVIAADLAQPLLQPWAPRHLGAVAGAAIYATIAVGAVRGWRPTAWLAVGMPLVPASVLTGWALGAPVPVVPDWPMVGVALLQVGVALAAVRVLRTPDD